MSFSVHFMLHWVKICVIESAFFCPILIWYPLWLLTPAKSGQTSFSERGRGLVPPSGFLSVLNWPLTNEHLLESQTGISAIIQGHGAIKSEEYYVTLIYVVLNNKIWFLNEFLLLRLYHEGVTCSSFWSSGPYQFHVIIRNEEMNTVLL